MKKIVLFLAIVFPVCFFYSCTHNPILPSQQVSFATDVFPTIESNCWHSGCHNDTANLRGRPMMNYNDVVSDERVVPGKPHDSSIYNAITSSNGQETMPKDPYQPLTDRQIKLIYIWIAQGAKNN